MDWMHDVKQRHKRKANILFTQNSPFLADLTALTENQSHKAVVLWAFELADETSVTLKSRYPHEVRFEKAIFTAKAWAAGEVKMLVAKQAILDIHTVAKEISSPEDIALCHAIGQACSVVHTPGHAVGFPIYELTAIIRRIGIDDCREAVELRREHYIDRLVYWSKNHVDHTGKWADFILKK